MGSMSSFIIQLGIALAVTRHQQQQGLNLVLAMEPSEYEKTLNLLKLHLTWQAVPGSPTVKSWSNYEIHFKNVWSRLPFFLTDTLYGVFISTWGFS